MVADDRTHKAPSPVPVDTGGAAGSPESAGGGAPGSGPPCLTRAQLEGVRAGDRDALAAFFECYFDRVFGLVVRLLGDRTAAEDVTQDVFYKVHRAAHQLDPERDPAKWLTTIAYNTCRDVWRSGAYRFGRRSASVEGDPAVAGQLTLGTNDPERDALSGERQRLVQEAIAMLPEPLRVAVVMYEYEGLSHQEVAEIMGINHAAARKRYSRALAALGEILRNTFGYE